MNNAFTKLFASIIGSSVWAESDKTRVLWITLLALCDARGDVSASVGGLAHFARLTKDDCEVSLKVLMSPDPESTSPEYEGRRIEAIPGGWKVLNYPKYRERGRAALRTEYQRVKQREYRAAKGLKKHKGKPLKVRVEAPGEPLEQ